MYVCYVCMYVCVCVCMYITYMSIRFSWSHDHGRNLRFPWNLTLFDFLREFS